MNAMIRPFTAAVLLAVPVGCAKPVLDVADPTERQQTAAKAAVAQGAAPKQASPALEHGGMLPAVRNVGIRVRDAAWRLCTRMKLPDDRCGSTLTSRVTVYTGERRINAFADQYDNIGVFGGLVRHMGSDAELAGVLAHEHAHVMLGHVQRKIRNARIGAVVMGGLAAATAAATRTDARQYSNQWMRVGAKVGSRAYSPEMEIEADRVAVYILRDAGFSMNGLKNALLRMQTAKGPRRGLFGGITTVGFLRTHPNSERRIAHMLAAVEDATVDRPLKLADPPKK